MDFFQCTVASAALLETLRIVGLYSCYTLKPREVDMHGIKAMSIVYNCVDWYVIDCYHFR